MKLAALIFIIFISLISQSAIADDAGFYIGGSGSTNFKDNDVNNGYGAGANFGYDFGGVRTDLEYTYRNNKFDGSNSNARIQSHAFMGNFYVDIPTGTIVKPYVGVGGGYAVITSGGSSDGAPAYQGMAGLDFTIDDNTTFYTGYKYFATSVRSKFDGSNSDSYSVNYHANNIEFGIRYKF